MFKCTKIVIGCLLIMFSMMAHSESSVSLSKSKITSRIGSVVTVDLTISDFATTEGGGIDILFDPKLVQINNVTVDGDTWGFANMNGDINNINGTVSGILFSSYQGVSGNAKIATIELEIIGKGKSKIILSESENNPFASNGEQMAVTFKSTRVRVRR